MTQFVQMIKAWNALEIGLENRNMYKNQPPTSKSFDTTLPSAVVAFIFLSLFGG